MRIDQHEHIYAVQLKDHSEYSDLPTTDEHVLLYFENGVLKSKDFGGNVTEVGGSAGLFIGQVTESGRQDLPSGWLWCDGSEVSRATYSELFAAIGTLWGAGDGSTTFNVPDYRERVGAGWTPSASPGRITSNNDIGNTGGAEAITQSYDQLAPHKHPARWSSTAGSNSGYYDIGSSLGGQHSSLVLSAGGGQSMPNLQPYMMVPKIIYAGV